MIPRKAPLLSLQTLFVSGKGCCWSEGRPALLVPPRGVQTGYVWSFRLARPSNPRGKRQRRKRGRTTCLQHVQHSGLKSLCRAKRAAEPPEPISNWHSSAFPSPSRACSGASLGSTAALPAIVCPPAGKREPGCQRKEPTGLVRRVPRLCPSRGRILTGSRKLGHQGRGLKSTTDIHQPARSPRVLPTPPPGPTGTFSGLPPMPGAVLPAAAGPDCVGFAMRPARRRDRDRQAEGGIDRKEGRKEGGRAD